MCGMGPGSCGLLLAEAGDVQAGGEALQDRSRSDGGGRDLFATSVTRSAYYGVAFRLTVMW